MALLLRLSRRRSLARRPLLNLTGTMSLKSNIHLKPFKNSGWPFYSKMEQIFPHHSSAQGNAAYNPTILAPQDEPPAASPSSAPPDASMMKAESAKKQKLLTTSGKMHSSAPKNDAVPEVVNTAVLMNFQGSINYLLDSLNKGPFTLTDDTCVAEYRLCTVKVIQSSADLSVDNKVLLMHVLMVNPAACDTILDIDDLELHFAFVHSIVTHAKQETITL
ncbi:hypothetical protein BDR04DRAFT_1115423 [Suillus decipiens]|nr:hypothetical protein BDR04DRAFT_1115423 [Suillus decipiens]